MRPQAGDPHLTTDSAALVWVATKAPRGRAEATGSAPCRPIAARHAITAIVALPLLLTHRWRPGALASRRVPAPRHEGAVGHHSRPRRRR